MKLSVKVFPKSSRRELIVKNGMVKAYINAAPERGKANKALTELIAEKYGVAKSRVVIIKGGTGRNKVVEVLDR